MHTIREMPMFTSFPSVEQMRDNFPSPIKDRSIQLIP